MNERGRLRTDPPGSFHDPTWSIACIAQHLLDKPVLGRHMFWKRCESSTEPASNMRGYLFPLEKQLNHVFPGSDFQLFPPQRIRDTVMVVVVFHVIVDMDLGQFDLGVGIRPFRQWTQRRLINFDE